MTFKTNPMCARLGIKGTFECRNAAGEVIKTIELVGAVPLTTLGINEDEAHQLVREQKEKCDGADDRE